MAKTRGSKKKAGTTGVAKKRGARKKAVSKPVKNNLNKLKNLVLQR